MADLKNVMGVSADDIKSIMGVDVGDIKSVVGLDFPSGVGWLGSRHIMMGWDSPTDLISYKSSTSNGDTSEFGSLVYGRSASRGTGTGSGKARGIAGCGYLSGTGYMDDYDYIACATLDSAADGGDLTPVGGSSAGGGASNGILMFFMGGAVSGSPGVIDDMDYITIATLGGSSVGGDIQDELNTQASVSGNTRGAVMGGITADSSGGFANYTTAQCSFITYHTTNNAADFGDLSQKNRHPSATSSQTRWVQKSGTDYTTAAGTEYFTTLEFYTADTESTAGAFGDVSGSGPFTSAFSDGTRGEIWGGYANAGGVGYVPLDNIWYITMASEGDGTDAGNLHGGAGYAFDVGLSGAAS